MEWLLRTFVVVWFGQLLSVVGSSLTSFALGVWIFRTTESVTSFALIGFCAVLPRVCLSPLAGVLIDRWDRRRSMIVADIGAGVCTVLIFLLLERGSLSICHIYLLVGLSSSFSSLQWPAYMSAVPCLVSNKQLDRANGLVQFALATADVLAPSLAAVLLTRIDLAGVVAIDLATFALAIISLLAVRFPKTPADKSPDSAPMSLRTNIVFGWRYIIASSPLRSLLALSAMSYFLWGMVGALITPMILGFTTTESLGVLLSIAGAGMVVGALAMSTFGSFRRRITGVIRFELLSGICFCIMGLRPSFAIVALGVFGAHLTIAFVGASSQGIWQSIVPHGVQGRVFATQQMLERAASPLAYLIAGPLVDNHLVSNTLDSDGFFSNVIGMFVVTGVGRSIGLVFVLMGFLKILVVVLASRSEGFRSV